ncbi:MAG: S8 family serine peptidase [Anaerolineaceae bacterium]|nr:S8 family serine peptidase [Anaerolineaceae bacterium]
MPGSYPPQKTARVLLLAIIISLAPYISLQPRLVIAASHPADNPPGASPSQTMLAFPLIWNNYHVPSYHSVPYLSEPSFVQQWNMLSIQADIVWNKHYGGDANTPVAILDTGIDLSHPDLAQNLQQGFDFIKNDNLPNDENGHGTHVAGIVAAAVNGIGILGVAPFAGIDPVRVMDKDGNGTASTVAAGVAWAAEHARIINLSLGGPENSSVLENAVRDAITKHDCLIIAASGNLGSSAPVYPAAYPGVIGVGAIERYGSLAKFSSYGSSVDVVAPGVGIYSAYLEGGYATLSGTSMAAAHVSGLAALIWENHPEYTSVQVANVIEATSLDLGAPGRDDLFGYGLIQADKAMSYTGTPPGVLLAKPQAVLAVQENRAAPFVPGRVLVKFRSSVQPAVSGSLSLIMAHTTDQGEVSGVGALVLGVAEGQEWKIVDELRSQPNVEYAEPDYIYTTQ